MPGISHELESLRRRARRLILIRGVAALLACIVGAALILGGVDALVRWQHPAGRLAQSAVWWAAILLVGWRFLVRPLRVVLSDLELARVIHRQWPSLTPDLTSAVEFEGSQLSTTIGAPLLQQVTVSRAQMQLATVPWQSVIVPGRTFVTVAVASLSVVLLGLAATLTSEMTGVGATRLISPLLDLDWPRRTTLVYLNSDLEPIDVTRDPAIRTGQGEPLTLYIENQTGALPAKVLYERKPLTGDPEHGELRQTTLRDQKGRSHQVAVASLPTSEPFQFHALGGDDDRAPWLSVAVVPAPRVSTFEIEITPPPYTGRPTEKTSSGVGHLQGLVGSHVHIRCLAAAPLQSVFLSRGNEPRKAVSLTTKGQEFQFDWTLADAERSTYWLDLVDSYGLRATNPPRYEIRGVADQEPVVSLQVPASDLRVTSLAELPIEGEAHDDLGLKTIELVYELPVPSPSGQFTVEPRTITLGPEKSGSIEQVVRMTWNLADLSLPPGSQVRFWLQATDACDLNGMPGQVGRSATRILTILSAEEKQQELSGKQIQLAEKISQLRDRQSAVEQSTREILEQWKSVGSLRPTEDLELDRVLAEQKEITHELSDAPRGLVGELNALQQERQQNQLTDPATTDSLAKWDATLSPLAEEVLPSVEKQLEATRLGTKPKTSPPAAARDQTTAAIESAHAGQLRALDDLTHLSSELANWQRDQDLEKRFTDIATRQSALRQQSLEVGQQTSTKTLPELSTQEQADLARAADRQGTLARDVEELISQLETANSRPEQIAESGVLNQMSKRLEELSVAATMRGIADELRQNHVQAATDAQQRLVESLEALQKRLDQDRAQTARNDVEELRKSLADASELSQRQAELRRRTEALSGPTADSHRAAESEEVQQLQKEIETQTTELAQRLRREQHPNSASAAKRASERMQEAAESLEQEEVAKSLDRQTEALDELEQARESLDQELQAASQRADEERLQAVGLLADALLERAKATRDETIRLDELRIAQGKWTRSQLKSVQQLAASQRDVAESCQKASEELDSSGVLGLCLNLATQHFTEAAKRLDERETGEVTQAEQKSGESLLDQFIASLPSPPPTPGPMGETPPSEENEESESTGQSPLLAVEIRLLLRMQEDLLTRTRNLADLKANGHELTPSQQSEFRQLRDRQKTLVETARAMLAVESPQPVSPASEAPDRVAPSEIVPIEDKPELGIEEMAEDANDPMQLLGEVFDAMDAAVLDLEQDSPTPEAVQHQQDAVDRLKELLQSASQSSSSRSNNRSQKPKSESDPSPGDKQPESNASDSQGAGGRRSDDENSAESSENVAGPTMPGTGVLGPGVGANSVWGHLPPRVQEALFRSRSDTFLPEYEAQIRRYYEVLAEQK